MHGCHPLKFWSRTQASVSLSSAEAELTAAVKSTSETLGLRALAIEMGWDRPGISIYTDSSAAHAVTHRQGAGRIKHVATQQLWIQERVGKKGIEVKKVSRAFNPSDLMTHHWSAAAGRETLKTMNMKLVERRP